MLSTRWQEVKGVFDAALLQEEPQRDAFVSSRCGEDLELAQEVHRLLIADHDSSSFLQSALFPAASLLASPTEGRLLVDGDVLCGRFKVLAYLGEGGMGQVYQALDLELRQEIAVKVIRPEIADIPGVLSHFRREVNATRRVTHPNVCRTFDLETHSPSEEERTRFAAPIIFLTMELLVGETVAERIRQAGALPPDQLRIFAEQVARALQAAHSAGVIHCDLKPSNIFITGTESDPRFVVTDFGIAKFTSPQDSSSMTTISRMPGAAEGTPFYMAPEQIEDGTCSIASDIYSYGLVLYEALTGQRLSMYKRSGSGIRTALFRVPTGSSETPQKNDPVWINIIARCIRSNPADRCASAQEILELLVRGPTEVVTASPLPRAIDNFVDFDNNLNVPENKISEVLGESAETPRSVETLPARGYRLTGPIVGPQSNETAALSSPVEVPAARAANAEPKTRSTTATRPRPSRPLLWGLLVLALSVVVALLIGAGLYLRRPLPTPRITEYARLTLDGKLKWPVGEDASRLYLNLGFPFGTGIVSLSGGEITRISFDVPNPTECNCKPAVVAVSPDGSRLLVTGKRDLLEAEIWNVESSGHSARFLTKAAHATWSPDGKQVLYSTASGDLLVIPSDGGEPRLILPSPAPPGQSIPTGGLSWSPDGARIRFSRDYKYWEISSSGTNLRRLLSGWDDTTRVCCGTWTPDGDFFLFLAGKELSAGLNRIGAQIWALDERKSWIRPSTAKPIRLTEGPNLWSTPVVSRDGKKIFAQQTTLLGELVRYDSGSKQYQPFLRGISAEFVAFSHDGNYVAYVSYPDGILWRAKLDGTERMQLTSPPFSPKSATWSPDGTQILFQDDSLGGEFAIYSISSQGGSPVRLVPEDHRPQIDPTWSPDGTQAAYCTDPRFSLKSNSFRTFETHILDLASRTVTTLPPLKDGLFSPRWSPDGRFIVGMTTSQAGLALFDLQTKQYRSLLRLPSNFPAAIAFNTWSHDSRYVYFLFNDALMRISIQGGNPETIIDLRGFQFTGWFGFWFALDPQDAPILLRDRGAQEIYALTLERN